MLCMCMWTYLRLGGVPGGLVQGPDGARPRVPREEVRGEAVVRLVVLLQLAERGQVARS